MGNAFKCIQANGVVSTQSAKAYFIFVAVVSCVLTFLGITAIVLQRNTQVVRVRRPWTIIATVAAMCILTVIACVKGIAFVSNASNISCAGYWFAYAILNAIAFAALVVRGWVVMFMFNLNQNYAARRKTTTLGQTLNFADESGSGRAKNWYVENRQLLKSRYLVLNILSVVLLLVVMLLIYFALEPAGLAKDSTTNTCGCMTDYSSYLFIDIPMGCVIVGASMLLLRNLDSVVENFNLANELYNIAKTVVGTGVCVTALFVFQVLLSNKDPSMIVIFHVTLRFFGPLIALMWFTVWQTVRLALNWDKVEENRLSEENEMIVKLIPSKPSIGEMREEMFEMLFDDRGFSLFREFLVKEFSVENILFYKDVKSFREYAIQVESGKVDLNEARIEDYQASMEERARRIYKEYCSDDAVLLVNLPFTIRNRLKLIFNTGESFRSLRQSALRSSRNVIALSSKNLNAKKIGSDVFAEALTEITNLMCSDSFRRFRMMDEYKEYRLEQYQRNQATGSVDLRGNRLVSTKADL